MIREFDFLTLSLKRLWYRPSGEAASHGSFYNTLIGGFLTLLALPAGAWAACLGQTFISCDTGDGNHLEVCIEPGAFTYAFGPRNAPDLTLREEMAAGTAQPWNGVGGSIWASVDFYNGKYSYEVWHSVERRDGAHLEAGVNVLRNGELLTALSCRPGSETVIAPAFTIEDAMDAAGFCRDTDTHTWRRGGCS